MRQLDLSMPPGSDRIIGFTIPRGGTFYICDHDEVWKVAIHPQLSVQETDLNPYEFVKGNTDFLGLVLKGLTANAPLLRVGESEIAYDFKPESKFVTVKFKVGTRSERVDFPILSGDWFVASLSEDGKYALLAEPYNIALYELG